MRTIELFFGVSPDAGNGSLEITIFALLLALAFIALRWKNVQEQVCPDSSAISSNPELRRRRTGRCVALTMPQEAQE
jgi:hypothetical protein